MNVAIIDLGTNTFNLLICSFSNNSYSILFSGKRAPKMGQGGIESNCITPEAFNRSIQALEELHQIICSFSCQKIIAIGTSALRNAHNATEFCKQVQNKFGFSITIISGLQEAEYIYWGNRLAYDWGQKTALILDIGGGSNEIIIATHTKILWKHSFENGMQRILSNVNPSYPLSETTITNITNYLRTSFNELHTIATKHTIDLLVGSSGPFDTFRTILEPHIPKSTPYCTLKINDIHKLHNTLITSTIPNIASIPGMDIARVEMLPIASIITTHICILLHIPNIIQSEYSLKEGVIYKILQNTHE